MILRTLFWVAAAVVFVFGIWIRFLNLDSDMRFDEKLALATLPTEEGFLHSGRIWALWGLGQGHPEDWMDTYAIAPLPNLLAFFTLRLFGMSSLMIHSQHVVLGILLWLSLFLISLKFLDRWTALLVLVFGAANPAWVAVSRSAWLETYLMLWQVWLYGLLFHAGATGRGFLRIGLMLALSMGIKASAVLFGIPVFFLALVLSQTGPEEAGKKVRDRRWFRLGAGLAGGGIAYAIFALVNWERWARLFLPYAAGRVLYVDKAEALFGFPTATTTQIFTLMPYLCLAAAAALAAFLAEWGKGMLVPFLRDLAGPGRLREYLRRLSGEFRRRGRAGPADFIVFWVWAGGILTHLFLIVDPSPQRVTHVIPPMILLAARGLILAWQRRPLRGGIPWTPLSAFVFGAGAWFCGKAFVLSFFVSADLPTHALPITFTVFGSWMERKRFILSGAWEAGFVAAILPLLLWLFKRRADGFQRRLGQVFAGALLLAPLALVNDSRVLLPVLNDPTYRMKEVVRKFRQMCDPGEVVLGYGAQGVMWDVPIYVYQWNPGMGIGYKGQTNRELDKIMARRKIRYVVLGVRDENLLRRGRLDWRAYLGDDLYRRLNEWSPGLFRYDVIVMDWPTFLNPTYGFTRWILVKRPEADKNP